MTDAAIPAVGIDLGTTFSVAWPTWTSRASPSPWSTPKGDRITPSVVLFDGQDVVVGKEAIKAMITESEHVAECAKRDMGHRVSTRCWKASSIRPR